MTKLALSLPEYTNVVQENLGDVLPNPMTLDTTTPADIIDALLPSLFVIAGIILFFMFLFGGFTIFTSAGNPEKIKKGQGMIVSGLVGFVIIFAAYWIIQFLEITFGLQLI